MSFYFQFLLNIICIMEKLKILVYGKSINFTCITLNSVVLPDNKMDDEDYTIDDDMEFDDNDIEIIMDVELINASLNPALANQLPPHRQALLVHLMQQNQNQPVWDDLEDDNWYFGR